MFHLSGKDETFTGGILVGSIGTILLVICILAISKRNPYICKEARKDIDFHFKGIGTTEQRKDALSRAMDQHLKKGEKILCSQCYLYYINKKERSQKE